MPETVYRVVTLLCAIVKTVPIGTNLGLVAVLWMLVSGRLLATRGALIPGLAETGLSDAAVRRAWLAVGHGAWTSKRLLQAWAAPVVHEQLWQPSWYEGYRPVAVDVTAFWRPHLQDCPTTHYSAEAGRALAAIPLGIIARIGRLGTQRLAVPVRLVRADHDAPSAGSHRQALLREAAAQRAPQEAVVADRESGVADMQAAGIPATPADQITFWEEEDRQIRAEQGNGLVLPTADANASPFSVIAVFDPKYHAPLLLATPLPLSPRAARDLYRDRWPVKQLPLAAKQLIGARSACGCQRQFVHEPETCQRLPKRSLLARSVLSYAAATGPAVPVGFWDRQPQPTPGRLRRLLARRPFPQEFPWPARLREKAAATAHLPKGAAGPRQRAAKKAA
ncbi:MAG: hypothetical protein ACR2JY_00940 [Chloroflexota bacterium]